MVISAVPTVGKNNQQILSAMIKQIKQYKKLINTYCSSARLEAALLVHVQVSATILAVCCRTIDLMKDVVLIFFCLFQVFCYEDSKLLKLFSDVVRVLYDNEIIAEDTILWWYKKGSHPKGRQVFQRDMEPFIKWLEEAEEEEEE